MSSTKAALKAAKAAIDQSNWDEAINQAEIVLSNDKNNYYAKLFLARAYEKRGEVENAAKVYHEAASLKPDETQPWQGLVSLYESQGSKYLDEYGEVVVKLAVTFGQSGDLHRSQVLIDKLTTLAKRTGTATQHKRALQVLLPGSPIYPILEGRIQHPSLTFKRLAEITEKDENAWITKEIAERRTRIGARLGQVTAEVKREIYEKSDLEGLYRGVIDWTEDDVERRQYEERLFERMYDTLMVMPAAEKETKRQQVVNAARGMVIVQHPCRLAWDVYLEWQDITKTSDLDLNVLLEYITNFPDSGLSRVLRAYLGSEVSPFQLPPPNKNDDEEEEVAALSSEDRLLLMAEGLGDGKASQLAHRLVSEYYNSLEEYESAIETTRTGMRLIKDEEEKAAVLLQDNRDAYNTILATALLHYQSPKNHPEAKELLEDIRRREPDSPAALSGLGLVYEEEDRFTEAIDLFQRALKQDPSNIKIKIEAAWCQALSGQNEVAKDQLEDCLEYLSKDDAKSSELRALVQYRIGQCVWAISPSKEARRSRKGAYTYFLASIKSNVNFAPAYTSLGFYYEDYAKDRKRARQCFQKAFELSPSEIAAAERLARAFADQGEWDIVELVSQRVIESGKTKPSPGSKRKPISWPFSALGVVQMTRQEYTSAITSFLSALRLNSDDYHSYVGLGESYHNSGRYNSASRTFHYAESPPDGVKMKISGERWFTEYMLANVHRELGDHDEAISRLQKVLLDRSEEFGVQLALLQTFVERAWRQVDTGFFGKAAESARDALELAKDIAELRPGAFNLWKAVGDACSVFHWTQNNDGSFSDSDVSLLLRSMVDANVFDLLHDVDGINADVLSGEPMTNGTAEAGKLPRYLRSAILAYKRAINCASNDIHAQAVAWYNLGWAEYRAYCSLIGDAGKKFSLAAVRCFKRAIELESGNSEFWNALGVVTSSLNVKVAQHAFVRSLYLNEKSAQTWTNLGVLYLNQNDHELAHMAFGRAQSTDPDCAHAWVGEGLIALSIGDQKEALSHFVHAFEIADSASIIVKKQYTVSVFDSLISQQAVSSKLLQLIQPLFALHQLYAQMSSNMIFRHLSALLSERAADHQSAIITLESQCSILESEYETTEEPSTLLRFAHAKSDLARNLLAEHDYSVAAEHATTSLDLTAELDSSLPDSVIAKIRLSAHLTLGLCSFYTSDFTIGIDAFRAALAESDSDPAVVCLLSQVLYATNKDEERSVAKDQLLALVQDRPDYVQGWILLAAIAGVERDAETIDAVHDDLARLQALDRISEAERDVLAKVLVALADVDSEEGQGVLNEVQRQVILRPDQSTGWAEMSGLVDGDAAERAAQMALLTAQQAVGTMDVHALAGAYGRTGQVGDAQRGVMLAPWIGKSWDALKETLDSQA